MSTVNTPRRPWHYTLEDSVYALGAAAREAQRAWKGARLAVENIDLDRIKPIDGQVEFTGSRSYGPHRPHDAALFAVGDVLRDAEQRLRDLYENTALAYAYGAAWAIEQVQAGKQPAHVELKRDAAGQPVFGLLPEIDLRCVTGPKLAAARETLIACEAARSLGDDLAAQTYLADHEAGEMHAAWEQGDGLPDAAYAYGLLAESGLHFVLIGPKAETERAVLAERRAAAKDGAR